MADLDDKELNPVSRMQNKVVKNKPQEEEVKEAVETAVSKSTAATEFLAEHTVVAGDNLSHISEQYYDTPNHYMKIYEANKEIIGDNPSLIRVGQVLKIPK